MCYIKQTSNGVNEIVLDVETKKSFDEVPGGRSNVGALGISVVGVYFYNDDRYHAYEEHEIPEFEKALNRVDRIIGFNINNFDVPVMLPYMRSLALRDVPTLDIFDDVVLKLGHRLSLNSLASATLGVSKSSDGLQALQWYKEGKIDLIKEYCLKDVQITKELYEFGKKNGHLLFTSKFDAQHRAVAVDWARPADEDIQKILETAMKNHQRLEIDYISREAGFGEGFKKTRKIDVYGISAGEISAYCHLRNDIRMFRIGRIVRVRPVEEFYAPPASLQASLF